MKGLSCLPLFSKSPFSSHPSNDQVETRPHRKLNYPFPEEHFPPEAAQQQLSDHQEQAR